MQAAQEAVAPGDAARRVPAAVLTEMLPLAAAGPQAALLPAVAAADAAHATAAPARLGVPVPPAPGRRRVPAGARARDGALVGRVELGEGHALAAVGVGHGAPRRRMRVGV